VAPASANRPSPTQQAATEGRAAARAATLLKTARNRLPADLYFYLVNDPAMRKYVREKELQGLYE
jgi:hypothetical protein